MVDIDTAIDHNEINLPSSVDITLSDKNTGITIHTSAASLTAVLVVLVVVVVVIVVEVVVVVAVAFVCVIVIIKLSCQ